VKRFAAILSAILILSASAGPITFGWNASTGADGYFVKLSSTVGSLKYDTETNRTLSVNVPPGNWYVVATAYSTNNSQGVKVESDPSNQVQFFSPYPPTSFEVHVDNPFSSPIVVLASNPVARVTIFLQFKTNLLGTNWSEGIPMYQYDLNDGTNAFYRTRLEVRKLP
jgi:hypothetical protein